MSDSSPLPLRERKRLRTRDAIRDAAMELFAERGFDAVSVTDIATHAEVGRSTFFRYFPDKQDVMFEDDDAAHLLLAKAIAGAARAEVALGHSLAANLRVLHSALLVLAESKTIQAVRYPIREQLIAAHPQLQACSLAKERGYTDAAIAALIEQQADPQTALLAAHIGTACYRTAYTETFAHPALLHDAVDKTFKRLREITDR